MDFWICIFVDDAQVIDKCLQNIKNEKVQEKASNAKTTIGLN